MQSKIFFYGGAGMVTGSNFLLDTGGAKFLVDCGLVQGRHSAEADNWAPFAYDPAIISHLIVTHAHIDHIGRVPLLVKRGFKGKIISTEATRALAEPMLRDSMELLQFAARRQGKELLYDEADITAVLALWEGISYHNPITLADGVSLELLDAGHILGSSMAQFTRGGVSLVCTGDIGGGNSPLLSLVEDLHDASYLVMESVYGATTRAEDPARRERLENIIEDTIARGGTLLIPAFSTERTQDLLFELRTLIMERRVPPLPVYLDSPLAETITESYERYPQYFSPEIRKRVEGGEKIFSFPELHFVENVEESARVRAAPNPKIIIAGSGMSNGGRVQSHERILLPDERSTLLIVGYQAAGSLGRRLLEGAKEVEIAGEKVTVRCRVESIFGYSAHMDGQGLLEFVNKSADSLKEVFVVEGEPLAAGTLVQRIRDYLGVRAIAPEAGESATLEF